MFKLFPGIAAVGGFEKPASGPIDSAARRPRRPASSPESGVDCARVPGVKGDVDCACVLILIENFLPRRAAIRGAENAALIIGAVGVAQRGHKKPVGVFGINYDARNLLGVAQPEVL